MVIADENDVLRDQGEANTDKLRRAGGPTTSVRFNGTIRDFMRRTGLRGPSRDHPGRAPPASDWNHTMAGPKGPP